MNQEARIHHRYSFTQRLLKSLLLKMEVHMLIKPLLYFLRNPPYTPLKPNVVPLHLSTGTGLPISSRGWVGSCVLSRGPRYP
mmetsp:Transcript_2785/g.5732  ORF Transcript_2785/g.5732 Transcript_2785/m.5732 type:complete len:82 (+) Transcript_2785:224-469(+)